MYASYGRLYVSNDQSESPKQNAQITAASAKCGKKAPMFQNHALKEEVKFRLIVQ